MIRLLSGYIFLIATVWLIWVGHLYPPRFKEWFEKCFSKMITIVNSNMRLHLLP